MRGASDVDHRETRRVNAGKAYPFIIISVTFILASTEPLLGDESARYERWLARARALEEIRETDPASYHAQVDRMRSRLQNQIQGLPAQQGMEFRRFLEQNQGLRRERIQNLRSQHPALFERYKQGRIERLNRLAQSNPRRFQTFLQNHPQLRERLGREMPLDRQRDFPGRNLGDGPEMQEGFGPRAAGQPMGQVFRRPGRAQFREGVGDQEVPDEAPEGASESFSTRSRQRAENQFASPRRRSREEGFQRGFDGPRQEGLAPVRGPEGGAPGSRLSRRGGAQGSGAGFRPARGGVAQGGRAGFRPARGRAAQGARGRTAGPGGRRRGGAR